MTIKLAGDGTLPSQNETLCITEEIGKVGRAGVSFKNPFHYPIKIDCSLVGSANEANMKNFTIAGKR